MINRLKFYFQRVYRLSLSYEKQEELFWRDLKKLHKDAGWTSGVYDNDKYIETIFSYDDESTGAFLQYDL